MASFRFRVDLFVCYLAIPRCTHSKWLANCSSLLIAIGCVVWMVSLPAHSWIHMLSSEQKCNRRIAPFRNEKSARSRIRSEFKLRWRRRRSARARAHNWRWQNEERKPRTTFDWFLSHFVLRFCVNRFALAYSRSSPIHTGSNSRIDTIIIHFISLDCVGNTFSCTFTCLISCDIQPIAPRNTIHLTKVVSRLSTMSEMKGSICHTNESATSMKWQTNIFDKWLFGWSMNLHIVHGSDGGTEWMWKKKQNQRIKIRLIIHAYMLLVLNFTDSSTEQTILLLLLPVFFGFWLSDGRATSCDEYVDASYAVRWQS